MAGEKTFLRIPPDSTGKRIRLAHNVSVTFTNKTPGYIWKPNREYMLSDGMMIHVHHGHDTTSTTGVIDGSLHIHDQYNNYLPANGVNIMDPDTEAVVATVDTATDVYINATNIVGFENPTNGVDVDTTGSMNVRFAEGLPQLDAFGKLRTSNSTLIGSYTFHNDTAPQKWSMKRSHSGGSADHNPATVSLDLNVGSASGNYVLYTTNTYHHYFPGSSQLAMMTLALSHSNLAGNVCRWGYFDVNDGFGFLRDTDGQLKVFIRNSCDADPDIVIPQSVWNGDKLDGQGDSGMDIDVSLDNLYWMDVQWLGAGRVRFGVFHNGQRIVCHEHFHNNTKPYPVSSTGSLPLCFVNMNTGTTGFSSTMKVFCAAVYTESLIPDITAYGRPDRAAVTVTIPAAATEDDDILAAVYAPMEYISGKFNRTLYWPNLLNISAYDAVTGADARVKVEIYVEPVVSGLNFVQTNPYSSVEKSTTGTFHGGGFELLGRVVKGDTELRMSDLYNNMSESSIKNYAEEGGLVQVDFASVVKGAQTLEVSFTSGYVPFREKFPVTLMGIQVNGASSSVNDADWTNFNKYVKITGLNTAEIWADADYTVPVTLETGTVTSLGHCHGFFGTQFYWAIVVHKQGPASANDINCRVDVNWKEIRQ